MEKLHKIVNGIRVDLSIEEEEAIKTEWEDNKFKLQKKTVRRLEKKLAKEKVIDKLLANLTEEEKELIRPNLT